MALKPVKVTMADHEPVVATLVTAGVGLAVMIEDEALVYREAGQAAVWDEIVGTVDLNFIYDRRRRKRRSLVRPSMPLRPSGRTESCRQAPYFR